MSSLVILTSLRRKGMSSLARNSLVVVLLQRLGFDHSRPRSPFETGASPLGIGAEVRSVKRFGPTCTGTPYVRFGESLRFGFDPCGFVSRSALRPPAAHKTHLFIEGLRLRSLWKHQTKRRPQANPSIQLLPSNEAPLGQNGQGPRSTKLPRYTQAPSDL